MKFVNKLRFCNLFRTPVYDIHCMLIFSEVLNNFKYTVPGLFQAFVLFLDQNFQSIQRHGQLDEAELTHDLILK